MVGVLSMTPAADAAPAGLSSLKRENADSTVIEIKRRGSRPRLYLPIVPYVAYDYPYYYRRGFYPTHIGPGYIYYGYPYYYRRSHIGTYSRCAYWDRACIAKWRYKRARGSARRLKGKL
jgi:hypothetical protein